LREKEFVDNRDMDFDSKEGDRFGNRGCKGSNDNYYFGRELIVMIAMVLWGLKMVAWEEGG
jgi:hypothetical protein